MDVTFINPFLRSMLNVLQDTANVKAKAEKPQVKKEPSAPGDVTGIMGLVGENVRGSLAISFTKPVAIKLTKAILNEQVDSINETVRDMVGELTNMVTGSVKSELAEMGYQFEMSIPTVIAGPDHIIEHKIDGPKVVLPFTTDFGKFYIEFCFVT